MSWKYYKKLFENGGIDENKFILGIDLGSKTSAIAYFNTLTEEPEIIDLSGGYGKPSMPSVVQYIPETKEWVFGEYALLNKGLFEDFTVSDFMTKIGKNEYIEMGRKTVSVIWLLSKYIKELIESCKNINPSSEVAGIVCAVPTYFSEDAKTELLAAFRGAGLEKQLIALISAREAILTHNHFNFGKEEKTNVTIDYGALKVRGSIDRLVDDLKGTYVVTESYYEENPLGLDNIDKQIEELFTDIYCAEKRMDKESLTEQEISQLSIFTHQNKAQMFKINQNNRPSKLYYNFAFPPFVKELKNETKYEFIDKIQRDLSVFIDNLFKNSKMEMTEAAIDRVICLGGGFENPFVKALVERRFPKAGISIGKFSKGILAEGAAVYAAKMLGIYNGEDFFIKDSALLTSDIGVKVRYGASGRFLPIIERNSFWWRKREGMIFTLMKSTDNPIELIFYSRGRTGEERQLYSTDLEGLEKRPKGATRLKISMDFERYGELSLSIEDFGFGEMFPKTNFKKQYSLRLS